MNPLIDMFRSAPVMLAQAEEETLREFRWLSGVPAWFFLLVILPVVVLFVRFIYRRERLSGGRVVRWGLISIRVAVIVMILLMIGEPVVRTTKFLVQESVFVVLVDDSLSMDIADKYSDRELVDDLAAFFRASPDTIESTKRYDLVRRLFRDDEIRLIHRLRSKAEVAVFSFSSAIQRLDTLTRLKEKDAAVLDDATEASRAADMLPDYSKLRVDERVRQTRIADALIDSVASARGGGFGARHRDIAGVVLISDGQDTGGANTIGDVSRRLRQRGITVHCIAVGNPNEPKDIRLIHLEANDVVLAGDKVPFDVSIVADGFEGESVRVDLKFDALTVDSESVVLEGDGRRQIVRLEYQPPDPGDFTATVEVEVLGGELFADNNRKSKPIRVLDQKIRVLYVEGRPRYEYRFLKSTLVRDPTVEAQVLLYSADDDFIQESSRDVPPLRRFPAEKSELFKYHVIIIGDVSTDRSGSARFLSANEMALIKEFVDEAGGGVVFIAGDSANPVHYRDTELYSLLPVEVPEGQSVAWVYNDAPITQSFNVRLTPAGKEHSLMRLDNDPERNIELWENPLKRAFENLPGFFWFAEVGRAKKGAVVLATHPEKIRHLDDGKAMPIFAYMNYGKGRTFFSAVDATWRWRALDPRFVERFWGQVCRFAATGRLLGKTPRYSITTDKSTYQLGESINVQCRVFDANLRPISDPQLTVYHKALGDADLPREVQLDLDPVRGRGTYFGTVVADRLGTHELWLGTAAEKLTFRAVNVAVPTVELRDPRRNDGVLKEIAATTGGAVYEMSRAGELIDGVKGRSQLQRGGFHDDSVWDEPWVLIAFTTLIAIEWMLRKAFRLL